MTDLYRASDVIMNLFLDVPTQTVAVPIQLVTWTSSLYSKVHHPDIDSSTRLRWSHCQPVAMAQARARAARRVTTA
jgi:hypothetical protein